jgi:hypothetical protein
MSTFENSSAPTDVKVANFAKYISRQKMSRFLAQSEIFMKQLGIKGSIIDCGVHHGNSLMTWAKLSAIHEPYNYHRRVFGFDTFMGFPELHEIDKGTSPVAFTGGLAPGYDILKELNEVISAYDVDRALPHIKKVQLVQGDATQTIPNFVSENEWLVVSLLYLDFDIYEPTKVALENFVPLMPKGAIIAFDEAANWDWPGETRALRQVLGINNHKLESFPWEPNISYIQL